MKPLTTVSLSLFLAAALLSPGTAHAANALGMTAEEMQELYGDSFLKQVKESETALQQMEEMDTQSTEVDSSADSSESEATGDTPGEPSADDEARQDEAAKKQEEEALKEKARKERRERAMLMGNVEILIKTKRAVDAKIDRSRNEIKNMRRKMAYIDTNLRKRRERERKRYEREQEMLRKQYNNSYGYNSFGTTAPQARPMRDIDLSTLDRNTVSNSQKRISQYKQAIPLLISFSQELTARIDTSSKKLGKVKSAIINAYEPEIPETTGSESESNAIDTKEISSFGN